MAKQSNTNRNKAVATETANQPAETAANQPAAVNTVSGGLTHVCTVYNRAYTTAADKDKNPAIKSHCMMQTFTIDGAPSRQDCRRLVTFAENDGFAFEMRRDGKPTIKATFVKATSEKTAAADGKPAAVNWTGFYKIETAETETAAEFASKLLNGNEYLKASGTQKGEFELALSVASAMTQIYAAWFAGDKTAAAANQPRETKAVLKAEVDSLTQFTGHIANLNAELQEALEAAEYETAKGIAAEIKRLNSIGAEGFATETANQPAAVQVNETNQPAETAAETETAAAVQ